MAEQKQINITKSKTLRIILITCGWINVGLAIIGAFLPVMPTTSFLLIAAACFARSSEKFYMWLINNKRFGKLIIDYREHRGMPLKAKIIAITMLLTAIGYSTFFVVEHLLVQILLVCIAVGVTLYLLSLKTIKQERA